MHINSPVTDNYQADAHPIELAGRASRLFSEEPLWKSPPPPTTITICSEGPLPKLPIF